MFIDKDNRVADNNKKLKLLMFVKVIGRLIKLWNTHKMKYYAAIKNCQSIQ